jgi:hypothetical protein
MTNLYSEDILSNYGADLQVLDMLNWLQDAKNSWGSPIPPALDSSIGKNDEQPLD